MRRLQIVARSGVLVASADGKVVASAVVGSDTREASSARRIFADLGSAKSGVHFHVFSVRVWQNVASGVENRLLLRCGASGIPECLEFKRAGGLRE